MRARSETRSFSTGREEVVSEVGEEGREENALAMRCFEYEDENFLRLASWIDVSSKRT